MTGFHLAIGLDRIDPAHYGTDGRLNACVKDAQAMNRVTKASGFQNRVLLADDEASVGAVRSELSGFALAAQPRDLVVISYSSHGTELPDATTPEGKDQALCLFDRMMPGREFQSLLAAFAQGVRIVVIGDACHNGTIIRAFAPTPSADVAARTLPRVAAIVAHDKNRALYEAARAPAVPIQASVISLTACRDDQTALDGLTNGAFTAALLATFGSGFAGTWQQFLVEIRAKMERDGFQQQPQFNRVWHDPAFLDSRPFEV